MIVWSRKIFRRAVISIKLVLYIFQNNVSCSVTEEVTTMTWRSGQDFDTLRGRPDFALAVLLLA